MATINNVKLDRPVEVYPCKTIGVMSTPLDVKPFWLTSNQIQDFVKELED